MEKIMQIVFIVDILIILLSFPICLTLLYLEEADRVGYEAISNYLKGLMVFFGLQLTILILGIFGYVLYSLVVRLTELI